MRRCNLWILSAALVLFLGVGFAYEKKAMDQTEPPAEMPACYHETKAGDWFTRLRALYLYPVWSSGSLSTIPNSGVSVHPAWTGEFDFGYMFTKYLGSELILATSYHTLWGKKALQGVKIGSTWALPPTLTLQIRLFPSAMLQPYVGGGVNYTVFYSKHCDLPNTSLSLSNSWGGAVQGGLDYFFYQDWIFNVDVKYIWINTDAHLSGQVPGKVDVTINPVVIGFGFGRKW